MATASVAEEKEVNGVGLPDPRIATAAVQVGGVRSALGGEKVRPRQG